MLWKFNLKEATAASQHRTSIASTEAATNDTKHDDENCQNTPDNSICVDPRDNEGFTRKRLEYDERDFEVQH